MPCSSEITSQNFVPIWLDEESSSDRSVCLSYLPHWPTWIWTISRITSADWMNVNQRSIAPLFIEERNDSKEMQRFIFKWRLLSICSSLNESLFAEVSSQNIGFFLQISEKRSKSVDERIFASLERRIPIVVHTSDFLFIDFREFFVVVIGAGLREKIRNERGRRIRIVFEDLRQLFLFGLSCHFSCLMIQE